MKSSHLSLRGARWIVGAVLTTTAFLLLWPWGAGAGTTRLDPCPGEQLIGTHYSFPDEPATSTPQSLDQAVQNFLGDAYGGLVPSWVEVHGISVHDGQAEGALNENLVLRAVLQFEQISPQRWELAGHLACHSWAVAHDPDLRGVS